MLSPALGLGPQAATIWFRQTFGSPSWGRAGPFLSREGFGSPSFWHLMTFECRREPCLPKGRRSVVEFTPLAPRERETVPSMQTHLAHTPLYSWHASAGGRLVDFAGWEMPVQYGSIVAEHEATRNGRGTVRRVAHGPAAFRWAWGRIVSRSDRHAPHRGHEAGAGPLCPGDQRPRRHSRRRAGLSAGRHQDRRRPITRWSSTPESPKDSGLARTAAGGRLRARRAANRVSARSDLRDRHDRRARAEGGRHRRTAAGHSGLAICATITRSSCSWPIFRARRQRSSAAPATPAKTAGNWWCRPGELEVWRRLMEIGKPLGAWPPAWRRATRCGWRRRCRCTATNCRRRSIRFRPGSTLPCSSKGDDFPGCEALEKARREPSRLIRVGWKLERPARAARRLSGAGDRRSGDRSGDQRHVFAHARRADRHGLLPAGFAKPGTEVFVDIRGRREPATVVELPFYRRSS